MKNNVRWHEHEYTLKSVEQNSLPFGASQRGFMRAGGRGAEFS